jgi:uncharacterized protein
VRGKLTRTRSLPWTTALLPSLAATIALSTAPVSIAAAADASADASADAGADAADYPAAIGKWRHDFDDDVRTAGWLTLVGRYQLAEGESSIGSDASSAIALPEGAPARLGVLKRHGRWVGFEPAAGSGATLDGAPLAGLVELATRRRGRVHFGPWSFAVRQVGDDYYVLPAYDDNPAVKAFQGTSWYAIDPAWRVTATFVAYAKPERRAVPMMHVDSRETMDSFGAVTFRLGGRTQRLRTFTSHDSLFVMFRDTTNGRGTYGGGRFLEAPLPKDGTVVLDFNKAFNPYCSVNSYVICPVVPAENHLAVPVTAGEKYAGAE